MHYPNGQGKHVPHQTKRHNNYAGRGMTLEEDINITNQFYLDNHQAVVHKKPTPVQIVKVHYPKRSAAMITEGYFKQPSTTDYNGLYRGRYIDFEAKETKNKTSFPLANIHDHQITHMKSVLEHDGICFLLIRFSVLGVTYYLGIDELLSFLDDNVTKRKSIPFTMIEQKGFFIPFHYQKRVDYLQVIDKLYF